MSTPKSTTPIKFAIMGVACRWCQAPIEVEIPEGLSPDEQLAECERQAEKHNCQPEVA